jgi:hypothetical protein
MVNGGGGDLIALGDRDVAPKKNREKKVFGTIILIFWKSNMGYSRRWSFFSLPILLWELAKHHVLRTKFGVLLEML